METKHAPQGEKKPSDILAGAIELLNGGANWIKEELWDGDQGYCLLGAVSKSYYGEQFATKFQTNINKCYPQDSDDPTLMKINDLILKTTGGIAGYSLNDAEETEFEDVRDVLCKATKLALEEESKDEQR